MNGETFVLYDAGKGYEVRTGPAAGGRPGYVTRVRRSDSALGDWQVVTTQPSEYIDHAKRWHEIYTAREAKRAELAERVQTTIGPRNG